MSRGRGAMRERSKLPGPRGGPEREEQVREIMELRRALARTRQDLQRSRGRGASSSDEEPCRREELSGSLSGSLNGLSGKPCLNRELVAKLRSMTETIKMLSTENISLREENDGLAMVRPNPDADNNELPLTDTKLPTSVQAYEVQVEEMSGKVASLEAALAECRERGGREAALGREGGREVAPGERDKYKALARRLKEERNQYRDMVEEKKTEQNELQDEMEKMTDIIGELRENCGVLQEELLRVRQEEPGGRRQDAGVQTGGPCHALPPVRRASLTELSPRSRLTPKRTISNISQSSLSSSPASSPRSGQLQRSIELSRPKQRSVSSSPASPSSPAKGARIAKPVARHASVPASPRPGPARPAAPAPRGPSSPRPSGIPAPAPASKLPSPTRSRLPLPTASPARAAPASERREVLHIIEEPPPPPPEGEEDPMSQSDSSSLLAEAEAVSRIVTVQLERVLSRETSPTMDTEEVAEVEEELPAPPSRGELEQLEDEVAATPRTIKRADNLRQKMAARRIQRTWKHFYQELEDKKTDSGSRTGEQLVEEEQARDDAISSIQAVLLGHHGRAGGLSAARARGGIFTARPWVAGLAGGALSEGDESEDDCPDRLQGVLRSHSFRLRTLHEEDVFRVGKVPVLSPSSELRRPQVSSIRAKFSRRSPDGASDDYLADSDRNV